MEQFTDFYGEISSMKLFSRVWNTFSNHIVFQWLNYHDICSRKHWNYMALKLMVCLQQNHNSSQFVYDKYSREQPNEWLALVQSQ